MSTPTYEEWFEAGFLTPRRLDHQHSPYTDLHFRILPEYLIRLYRHDAERLNALPLPQLALGMWWAWGVFSENSFRFLQRDIPLETQVEVIRSMGYLYRNVLDKRADQDRQNPAQDVDELNDLDGTIYMRWDIDGLDEMARYPCWPHLTDPLFEVLEIALNCQSVACQISAIHGLGHLRESYFPERSTSLLTGFLAKNKPALPWVAQYADAAIHHPVL